MTTTNAELRVVKQVVEAMCDVCHREFCDGDQICAFSIDPRLPPAYLEHVAHGIWLRLITYHSHQECMGRECLH